MACCQSRCDHDLACSMASMEIQDGSAKKYEIASSVSLCIHRFAGNHQVLKSTCETLEPSMIPHVP